MHLKSVSLHPEKYPNKDCYPFNLAIFHESQPIPFTTPVTLFAGENGTGKSTLLEAVARRCGIHIWREAGGGRVNYNRYEDKFYQYVSVEWANGRVVGSFFGSSIFRDFARVLDDWAAGDPGQLDYFGGRSLLTQSHGQSLMSFFKSRYQLKGLHLLDEPETALSPRSQLGLLEILAAAGQAGQAQFIIATHSPLLLACPGAVIYSFDGPRIGPVAYEETEHYRIYKSFMEDRRGYLKQNF